MFLFLCLSGFLVGLFDMQKSTADFIAGFSFCFLLFLIFSFFMRPSFDATDNIKKKERSGLILRTDYQTGCQYLVHPFGGITPRLDKNGKIVCIKEKE